MDMIEKIHDAIKSHEKTEDVILLKANFQFTHQGVAEANAIAMIGNPSEKRIYSLKWNPLHDGFEVKHVDKEH